MSEINTGGPAFPQGCAIGDRSIVEGGMTKREYYATHLNAGESMNQPMAELLIGRPMPDANADPVAWFAFWFDVESKIRFMRADAMIAASKEGGEA